MKTKSLTAMLSASLLFMLMPEYIHADEKLSIKAYRHRGCILPPTNINRLARNSHIGLEMEFSYPKDPKNTKQIDTAILSCMGDVEEKRLSCNDAVELPWSALEELNSLEPFAGAKCEDQFKSEVRKCLDYYEQKTSKCHALGRGVPLSKGASLWEELIPDDSPSGNYEELPPSDDHLYKTRKDQKGGPADNWKKWVEGNLPGNKMGDMGIDRKGGDMPSSGYSGAKFRDPNPTGKSGVDLKDLIRLEEREMLEEEKKEYGTLGSPGGPINPGGAMNKKRNDACERAKRRAAQTIPRITPSRSMCTTYRTALRMYESVRRILSSNGCPAHEVRQYDQAIAQTKLGVRAVCADIR